MQIVANNAVVQIAYGADGSRLRKIKPAVGATAPPAASAAARARGALFASEGLTFEASISVAAAGVTYNERGQALVATYTTGGLLLARFQYNGFVQLLGDARLARRHRPCQGRRQPPLGGLHATSLRYLRPRRY